MGYAYGHGYGHTWKPDKRAGASLSGGGGLLLGEKNGWATDFLYPDDSKRVALNTGGSTKFFDTSFFTQGGTSPKMVYDAAGTLGWSPHNLCLNSKDASLAGDTANTVVTTNVTAGPLGDVTADQIAFGGANNSYHHMQAGGFSIVGAAYCGAVWLKAAAPTQIGLRLFSAVGTHGIAVVSVTTAWQQFSVSFTNDNAGAVSFGLDNRTFVSGADGLAKIVIAADWQVNRGTVPTAYLPTTTAARVGLALDYDPVTHAAKGLLCEPVATNLVVESAMGRPGFLAGGNGSTRTTSAQTDPAGGSQALQVVITNALASTNVFKQYDLASVAATYTGSMWIKGTASQQVYLLFGDVPGQQLVTFTGSWQRVSMTTVAGATTLYLGFETLGRSNPNLPAVTFHVWGAQLELGTVATSYIPTLAATVTRAADAISVTPASINYSATAGSWWADISPNMGGVASDRIIDYQNLSMTPLYLFGSTAFGFYDGTTNGNRTVPTVVGRHRVMAAFASADRAITADGLVPTTDTTAGFAFSSPGALIGFGGGVSAGGMNGYIRQIRYLPRRPINAEMQIQTILPGGASMLGGELNGLGIDFTWPTNTERVAIATAGILSQSTVNSFMQNSGTSPKMIYDVTGRLGWSPHNLCLQSSTFDSASWGKNSLNVIVNSIGNPITGIMDAETFAPTTGLVSPFFNQTLNTIANTAYNFSIYLKNGTLGTPWLLLRLVDGSTVWDGYYNLATGLKGSTIGTVISSNMIAAGGGWYRCDLTYTSLSTNMVAYVAMAPSDGGNTECTTGNGTTPGFYAWGAQLNNGLVPTTYIPTTTAAKVGVGEDYDPVTHAGKGILVELAATNNILWSTDMTHSPWFLFGGTSAANAAVAPDGTTTAIKIIDDGASAPFLFIDWAGTVTGRISIYAKAGEYSQIVLAVAAPNVADGFDLLAGTTFIPLQGGVPVPTSGTALIENVGNGWYRCSSAITAIGDSGVNPCVGREQGYTFSAGKGVYLWGPQCEANTFATSYIPTTTATVTRTADNYSFLLSTMPAFSTEFTLYSRWQTSNTNSSRFAWCVTDSQGAPNDYAGFFAQSAQGRMQVADQTVSQASIVAGALVANTTVAMAGRVKGNDCAASMNGAAVATDLTVIQPTVTHVRFGNTGGSSSALGQCYVEKMAIICRGLSNAELVTKSAT